MGTVADWLAGVVGAGLLAFMIAMVRIALGAERRRADDWRTAAQTQSAANEVHSTNIAKLITSVEQLSASQREVLTLLHKLSAPSDRRDAA